MAKQLSRKVIDALERSISGFKHDIILEIIHVVLRGVSWNQIHFLPGLAPPSANGRSHRLPMVHRLFLLWQGSFFKGECSKIVFKSSNLDQTKTSNTILGRVWLGNNNKNKKKRPSGWKPLKTCHYCICIIPSHAREQRNKHLARAPTPLIIPVDEYRD